MGTLNRFEKYFDEHMTAATHRFVTAIDAKAGVFDVVKGELTLDKQPVLEALKQQEGNKPSDDTIRQRIKKTNEAFAEIAREKFDCSQEKAPALLKIQSRKSHLQLLWDPNLLKDVLSRIERSDPHFSAANMDTPEDKTIRPELRKPPIMRVFVSHAWIESEEIEGIKGKFIEQLEQKLRHLPLPWRNIFRVKLWFDKTHIHGTSETFEDQTDTACNEADFAIFLTSDKWFGSEPCKRERKHFTNRKTIGNKTCYLRIQMNDTPRDNEDSTVGRMPCYPRLMSELENPKDTLLDLFKADRIDEIDKFTGKIRDDICRYLELVYPNPRSPQKAKKASRANLSQCDPGHETIIQKDTAITLEMLDKNNAEQSAEIKENDSFDALTFLLKWAKSTEPEKPRMLNVLGSFGSGKTITMQLLDKRLRETASEHPATPLYLDFRRLIGGSKYGEPLEGGLAKIIYDSLSEESKARYSESSILDEIRQGHYVVILDGLDEIGNRIGRENASTLYRQFIEIIPSHIWHEEEKTGQRNWKDCKTRLILTCRSHFFRSLREERSTLSGHDRSAARTSDRKGGQIVVYYMAPLTREKIKALFVTRLGEDEGARCFSLIQKIHDLPGLAQKPLFAHYISETIDPLLERHESGKIINIATIYEEIFLRSIERDNEKRPLLSDTDRRAILTELARQLYKKRIQSIKYGHLEKWFDAFSAQHNGILNILRSGGMTTRSLLILELHNASLLVRHGEDQFQFTHTSFYEYFLALAINEDIEEERDITWVGPHSISTEVIEFFWAIVQESAETLDKRAQLGALLCQDTPQALRQFLLDLLAYNAGLSNHDLPPGANLAELDLSRIKIRPPERERRRWEGVSFAKAYLSGFDAQNLDFYGCDFSKSFLGQSYFNGCSFHDAQGEPADYSALRHNACRYDPGYHWLANTQAPRMIRKLSLGHNDSVIFVGFVSSARFSPDGRAILTAFYDNIAILWDRETGREICRFVGHDDWVTSARFAPDGRSILTASYDKTARLWDRETGREIRRFIGHDGKVTSARFAPDGRAILTASSDKTARLWDIQTGKEIRHFTGHDDAVKSASFAPDGRAILTASYDKTARLWDRETDSEIRRFIGHDDAVTSASFAPDGRSILTASDDKTARLWDRETGREIRRFNGHDRRVTSASFAPDGRAILTASIDSTAILWDRETGREIRRFNGHDDWVTSASFAPDGRAILTASHDKTARLWDRETGSEIRRFNGHSNAVTSASFAPDGRTILTASADKTARLWDIQTGKEIRRFVGHDDWVTSASFAPDGRAILTASHDNIAILWNRETGKEIGRFVGHDDSVTSARFAPDGRSIVTASRDGSTGLWDRETATLLWRRFDFPDAWAMLDKAGYIIHHGGELWRYAA